MILNLSFLILSSFDPKNSSTAELACCIPLAIFCAKFLGSSSPFGTLFPTVCASCQTVKTTCWAINFVLQTLLTAAGHFCEMSWSRWPLAISHCEVEGAMVGQEDGGRSNIRKKIFRSVKVLLSLSWADLYYFACLIL